MEKETVTISKEEYEELLYEQRWLRALEDAGLDNWGGISYANRIMDERGE